MVDRERVLRLLNRIERDVGVLADLAARDGVVDDAVLLGAVKYHFVTAIGGCAKVAHHLAAAQGWPVSDSNGDAVRGLGDHGVLDPSLASAVGFRNLLVHQYADVDDERTVAHLNDLDGLRQFTRQVADWLRT